MKRPNPVVQQINQAPAPTLAPPVTSTAPEVVQAEQEIMQQNMAKKNIKKTIMAGDTGGFQANPMTQAKKLGA